MVATAYREGGQGAGDREKRGREVYGKRDYQGGGKRETKGTITQHCAIFRNRKNAVKDVRAKNFYNTDFFHTLATVR